MARARATRAAAQAGKTSEPSSEPGIELHVISGRATELLKERERLLRDVRKKKLQIEQATEQAARESRAMLEQMAPLMQRHRTLAQELRALFDELMVEGRLSKRARSQIARVRRSLELTGALPRSEADEADAESAFDDDRADEPRPYANDAGGRPPRPGKAGMPPGSEQPELESAKQHGKERQTLRGLFRSLARSMHPDQARHEPERERRTAAMKEVTRAYADGDLARLIELEQAWQAEQALTGMGDPQSRCEQLERINRELLTQVRQLVRKLRDVKRAARDALGGPLDALLASAESELGELDRICSFVRKFRDGQISLAEFMRGPALPDLAHEDEELDLAALLEDILAMDQTSGAAPKRRGRQRGKRSR